MNEKEKKANDEKFLKHISETLEVIMDKRPPQPVYEYANLLLKAIGRPKEDYLERVKARKENEDDSKGKKKRKSSSSSSEDSGCSVMYPPKYPPLGEVGRYMTEHSGPEEIKDTTNEDNYESEIKMIQKRKMLENEFGSYDWSDSSSSDSSDKSDDSEDSDKPKNKKKKSKKQKKGKSHKDKKGDDAEKKE